MVSLVGTPVAVIQCRSLLTNGFFLNTQIADGDWAAESPVPWEMGEQT